MNINKQQAQLLKLLQQDASLSQDALAEQLHRSRQSVGRDLNALEAKGIVQGKTILIDARQLGLTTTVYVLVELKTHGGGEVDRFEQAVRSRMPHVVEFANVLGAWDVLLKLVVRDNHHLSEVQRQLADTPNVSRTCGFSAIGTPRQFPLPLGE